MKKFLALLVALSLLAFAGSAFATGITANPAAVTVTAGQTATATITGTASHGGDLSYAVTGDGAAFTTLSGTTLTFAPAATVQANTYTVTVTVTESYNEGDPSAAGHSRPATETATTDITVTVNSPVAPLTFSVRPSATTIMAGETVNFTFSSTGGNGGTVFSLVDAVEGVVFGNVAAIFTPTAAGTYTLVFTATDSLGIGAVQVQTVTITVTEVLAAKAVLSKNPISVDEQVTITLTATGGIGAKTFSTTTAGVSLGSTTYDSAADAYVARATFNSAESGIFALRFTATDTATPEPHTATAAVSVIVDAPAPEPEPEDVVEVVSKDEVSETVTVSSHTLSSDLTTEVNADTINNTMSKNSGAAIASDDSYSEEEKALAEGVDEKNDATVDSLKDGETFPADAENVPQEDITVTPTASTNHSETVAQDNANAGRGSSAPFMGFGLRSPRDGIVKVPAPRQPVTLWGLIIRVLKAVTNASNNRALPEGFVAAADDNTDATVFLDSNGNVTTTIPTSVDVNGNPRIGGFMTVATYVKAGENYDMILSVPTEELDTAGIVTTTQEVEVPIAAAFSASSTSFFSTFVSSDIITGTDFYRVGENALTSKLNDVVVRNDWARTPEELAMATDNNYTMITRLASLDATAEEATHTYIVAATFSADQAKRDRIDTSDEGGFIFYPNGPANAEGYAQVLQLVTKDDGSYGFDDLTPADIKAGVTKGYLAFAIEGGSALTKPMLAVKLVPATTEFSFALSTSGITVQQGSTETVTITPVNNSGDVSYTAAYEGSPVTWITFNGNVATFAPTTSTAVRPYTITITGVDEALRVYSTDISVVVTSAGGGGGGSGTEALEITASKSSLNVTLGNTETITLSSNALGTATYSVTADEAAGVELDEATGVAVITPLLVGTYPLVFTVTDSGRAAGSNTDSITVNMVVTSGGVGSSGGGCDAGFGVLALAVLGGFIAARKK